MKNTIKLFTLFLLLTLSFVPTRAVQAQGPNPNGDGQVIFGSNYTVESGDTFEGDLVVFGGNVTIEEDASLSGDLVVIGGTIKSNGEAQGDVVVVGGQITLEEAALVAGDVVTIGGQLDRAEGAQIEGDVVNNVAPNITFPSGRIPPTTVPGAPSVPDVAPPNINIDFNPFGEFFGILVWGVGAAAFAMLLSLFWQPQIERTGQAIISQPLMTGAIGLLAVVVAAILFLTILPPIIVAFAWFFGIVAMGLQVGERLAKSFTQEWTPPLTIGFGTFLLVLAGGIIGLVPCLGGIILFLLGLVGIGASVVTLFGTRPIQIPGMTIYTPPPPSSGAEQSSGQAPPAS
jgi:hypothetical protein